MGLTFVKTVHIQSCTGRSLIFSWISKYMQLGSQKIVLERFCLGSKKPMIDILSLYCKYVYKIRISWKLKPNLTYNSTTLGKSQLLQYTRAGQRHYCMKLGYTNYIRGIVNLQTFWPSFHIPRSTVKHCVHCAIVIRPQMFLVSKN